MICRHLAHARAICRVGVVLSAVSLVALASFSASAGAAAIETFQTASWSGGAYSNDENSEFSSCSITPSSRTGTMLVIVVDRNYQWFLSMFDRQWKETPDATFDFSLAVDDHEPDLAKGKAITPNHIFVSLGFAPAIADQFRAGHRLAVTGDGRKFTFTLDGAAQALNMLLDCVQRHLATAERAPSEKPTPASIPPANSPRPQWARAEAASLISRLAANSGIAGFHLADMNDVPPQLNGYDAVWTAPNVIGALLILQSEASLTPAEAAVALLASATRDCRGKFESSLLRSDQDNSSPSVRLFTTCADLQSRLVTYYTLEPRAAGGLYVFTVISPADQADAASKADIAIRVAARQVLENGSAVPPVQPLHPELPAKAEQVPAAVAPATEKLLSSAAAPPSPAPDSTTNLPPGPSAPEIASAPSAMPPDTAPEIASAPSAAPPENKSPPPEASANERPSQSQQPPASSAPAVEVAQKEPANVAMVPPGAVSVIRAGSALPEAMMAALLKRGDELLAQGDISAARLLYERTAEAGNARAAASAGKTYDPIFYQETGVRGERPDAAKAITWYRKAAALGDNEGAARAERLEAMAGH
jgi:hypothetical protein